MQMDQHLSQGAVSDTVLSVLRIEALISQPLWHLSSHKVKHALDLSSETPSRMTDPNRTNR